MDRMEYTQAVATMRVYEKRLLDPVKIERMIDAPSAEEVLKIMQETEYSRSMGAVKRPQEFETVLTEELNRVYAELDKLIKDPGILDLLRLKYDYQNLKSLVKQSALGSDQVPLFAEGGTVDPLELKTAFESESLKDLPGEFAQGAEAALDDFDKNKDPQRLDIIIDQAYFRHLRSLGDSLKDLPMLTDYITSEIDGKNLLSFLRMKQQERDVRFMTDVLTEGGQIKKSEWLDAAGDTPEQLAQRFRHKKIGPSLKKGLDAYAATNRLSELEKLLANQRMALVRPGRQVVFGPEPIFGYAVAKEAENQLLRMIMVSKLNGISPDRIRERVRDMYV